MSQESWDRGTDRMNVYTTTPYMSLIKRKIFGVSSCIIMMKPEGILSKFPYKGPNWTSSSPAAEYLLGELSQWRLKQDGPRETPSLKHTQKTHMHGRRTEIQTVWKHGCTSYISLEHTRMQKRRFAYPWVAPHSQTWPEREEDQDTVFCHQLSLCRLLLLMSLCLLVVLVLCVGLQVFRLLVCLALWLHLVSFCPSPLSPSKHSDQWLVDMPIKYHILCYWALNL